QRDTRLADNAYDDLRSVMDFARSQGAKHLVLMGASLGGMATAKAEVQSDVTGVVIISSPMSADGLALHVTSEELTARAVPKLFIVSTDDNVVPSTSTQQMFEQASQPKEFVAYPGDAHGTTLFGTSNAGALTSKLLKFLTSVAPRAKKQSPD